MSQTENTENLDSSRQSAPLMAEADIVKAEAFAAETNTSVLVIFFDDMKGSVVLKRNLGEQDFQKLRKEHDEILTSIITRDGSGKVIKSTGDGLLAVFSKPSTAVESAIEIQRKLHGHRYISVRIGMDMGEVTIESVENVQRDVFGRHVDRAARAMALADAGHICVTRSIYDDAFHWIFKAYISWKEHGLYSFKANEPPLEVYEPYDSDITTPMSSLQGKKVENGVPMTFDQAKVLVIDDEIGVRESIRMILKDNYDVVTMEDPIKALEYLSSNSVNVVFLDIRMPQMNGIEVLKKIKKISPNIEVIIVTAYSSFPTAQEALRYEASDYLVKPFRRNDIDDAVKKALKRQSPKLGGESSTQQLKDLMEQLRNLIHENHELNKFSDLKSLEFNRKRAVELSIVQAISKAVLKNLDLRELLRSVLDQIRNGLGYDNTVFFLLNEQDQVLEGIWKNDSLGNVQEASEQKLSLSEVPLRIKLENENGLGAQISCPIVVNGNLVGMIRIDNSSSRKKIDDVELELINMLAEYVAIAIKNAKQYQDLEDLHTQLFSAYDTTIEGWSKALDLRDKETEGHSQRVTDMTLRIARAMEIKDEDLAHIRRGALLHDIGKMGIPDSILLKAEPLSDEEWEIMKKHPVYAYELLSPIEYLHPALEIPYSHHEKWDGSGYPRGLRGEEIPLAARIFAVADVWDAMRADRPYRAGWPAEKVRDHILSLSGSHLDPKVVEVFLKLIADPSKT